MKLNTFRSVLNFLGRPLFLVLNGTGIGLLIASQWLPDLWRLGCTTVGSAFLTIGITLPVALFFQTQSNADAFKILNTCASVGIDSIFVSRKRDSDAIRAAIDEAITRSTTINLLGIAFRSFLNPSSESTEGVQERLYSPSIRLRVLLLAPDSQAAIHRAAVEQGNVTIDDIRYTLNNSLVSLAQERLKQLLSNQPSLVKGLDQATRAVVEQVRTKIQLEVRTYDTEPIVFLMMLDSTMFAEQYHRGRPDEIVPVGSCIGKYMPVIQYRGQSAGFRFLESHFEQVWNENEKSDSTMDILSRAIEQQKKTILKRSQQSDIGTKQQHAADELRPPLS